MGEQPVGLTPYQHVIDEAYQALDRLAHTDLLTGLDNRRQLIKLERYPKPLSMLISILMTSSNSTTVADVKWVAMMLITVADILRRALRQQHVMAHFGGDQFVVLLVLSSQD